MIFALVHSHTHHSFFLILLQGRTVFSHTIWLNTWVKETRKFWGKRLLYFSSSIGTTTLGWVSACSTVVEHSQQEGFTECRCQRHVKPLTWRRTRDLERSNFRHKRPPASEATLANPAAEVGTMGERWPRILPKVAPSTSLLGSFTCRKARHGTDGFTSPPKEGVLRIFSPEKSDGFDYCTCAPLKSLFRQQEAYWIVSSCAYYTQRN
jgi:hypothetical protein